MRLLIVLVVMVVSLWAEEAPDDYPMLWERSLSSLAEDILAIEDADVQMSYVCNYSYLRNMSTLERSKEWFEGMFIVILNLSQEIDNE